MPRADDLGVLIVDAGERSAVAACESLFRAGYRVGAASSQWPPPAGWSRFCDARFKLPNPRHAPADFAARVAAIASERRYQAVLPCSEGSLWAISTRREAFVGKPVTLGLPEEAVVDRCTDKMELIAAAAGVGLGAPETVVCTDAEAAHAAAAAAGYPAVLKPLRTVFTKAGETRHVASSLVHSPADLDRVLAESGSACLVQRREPGPVVSLSGVLADGRLLGLCGSRYLRTWPPEAGPVSFSRSFAVAPELRESLAALVARLGWEGIFELEAIERGPGDYAVLDFNPRVYGSLALAVKAGAPLPAIWCDRLLKGHAAEAIARPGVYYRWEDADLRNALRSIVARKPAAAGEILRPRRRVAHAYFRWYDPMPAVIRLARPSNRLRRLRPAARRAREVV